MKTLSYVKSSEEEIEVGNKYYFGQLWDGNGDGKELLESSTICVDGETIVDFEQLDNDENIMEVLVKVTDIN